MAGAPFSRAVALASAVLLARPAVSAENPRITLSLRNATPREIVQALSKASGISVTYQGSMFRVPQRPGPAPDIARVDPFSRGAPAPEPRFHFEWREVRFADALREVRDRLQCRIMKEAQGGGYRLLSFGVPDRPPGPPAPPLVSRDGGTRLSLASVSVLRRAQSSLGMYPRIFPATNHLLLSVQAEGLEVSPDLIVGFRNVAAGDDLGQVIATEPEQLQFAYNRPDLLPDEWMGQVSILGPHPRAARLAWIEGEIVMRSPSGGQELEVPLPPPGEVSRRRTDDFQVLVFGNLPYSREAETERPAEDVPGVPIAIAPRPPQPQVRVRLYYRTAVNRVPLPFNALTPRARGASGRIYGGRQFAGHAVNQNPHWALTDATWSFDAREPLTSLFWEFPGEAALLRVARFRFTNVPLPQSPAPSGAPGAPPAKPAGIDRPAPAGRDHPFFHQGGAGVVFRVTGAAPPAGGWLVLGLAAREGPRWGPTRWFELRLAPDGTARLDHVRAGEYQVTHGIRAAKSASGTTSLSAPSRLTVGGGKLVPPITFELRERPQ